MDESDNNVEICKYFTLEEFNKLYDINNLSLFHLNIASLKLHIDDLDHLLQNSKTKFDIIGISETGIKSKTNFSLDGYCHVDCFTEVPRGGVRICLVNSMSYIPRPDLTIYKKGEVESIFVEILSKKNTNYIIGCIYKHPKMQINDFNILYKNTLNKITHEKKESYIMGDSFL